VVEDNANNQQVARELLEDEGAVVQIADNGLLAVEAVAAADSLFDVVLMDLQMPVMDGYTAATRIRQDLQHLALPIVAMTANAMASDREACLAAGMNEHVGKPFDLEHLVSVLLRLAGRAAGSTGGPHGNESAMSLSPQILAAAGTAGVDFKRALARLGGKLKVYRSTLRSFTAELRGLPHQLNNHLQRGDRDAVLRELHTLKGAAGTIGVTALAKLVGEAEAQMAGISPAADDVGCVSRVGAAIDLSAASLEALCIALDGGQAPASASPVTTALTPADTALLASLLRNLQALLQASDLDATNTLQTLRSRLPAAAGPRFDKLETAVDSLEFESALLHCSEWLLECEA
jgi:CheY-like chemotaxis protein